MKEQLLENKIIHCKWLDDKGNVVSEFEKIVKIPKKMENNIKFELNSVETQRAHEWMKEHCKVCPVSYENGNVPAAGEHFYFKIVPHGLGCSTVIGCLYCKDAKKDITDIDSW